MHSGDDSYLLIVAQPVHPWSGHLPERLAPLTLRARFLLFSTIFLGILGILTTSVWLRGLENERAQRQIESDLEESAIVLVLEDQLEVIHTALLQTQQGADSLATALGALAEARRLVAELENYVAHDEVEDDAGQKEMQAVEQLVEHFSELDAMLQQVKGNASSRAAPLEQEALFRTIDNSLELFREGAFEEVHEAVARLNDQQNALESLTINGALVMLLLLGLAWIGFSYGLLKPVRELTRMTRRLSKIDFTLKENKIPRGELGELTLSFISMARSLESFTRDIEARVEERTRELEASRSLLRLMLESLPDAVGLRREDESLLACNGVYEALFPDSNAAVSFPTRAERTPQGYYVWRDSSGRSRLLDIQTFSARIPDAETEQVRLEYVRDVTRLTEIEAALAQTQRLASLGRLAAGIAHEVNSPLTAIGACAEGLIDRSRSGMLDPVEVREYLEVIHQEVYRCKSLTERLLDLSRQRQEDSEPLDVYPVVEECLKLLAYLNKNRRIEVAVQRDASVGNAMAVAKPAALRQICINLLMNANNACSEGARIDVQLRATPQEVFLQVCDEGSGVSPEDMDRLFEPFFTKRKTKDGTGLGLFLCRELAASMGGELTAHSDGMGTGACFELRLQRHLPERKIQEMN